MGKKKLIVIWPYRFRDFDWQRFELDFLAPHVEIQVHELIDALTPEFGAAYANQSENPAVQRFASLKEWRKEFKKISKGAIIFSHVAPESLKVLTICWTIRRVCRNVVGISTGGVASSSVKWGPNKRELSPLIKKFLHVVRRNLLWSFLPNFVFTGGSEYLSRMKRESPRYTRFILGNSSDFSHSIRISLGSPPNSDKLVYLDTGFPGFPRDELLVGLSEEVDPKDWYPKLDKFFGFVERELKNEVEIAIHPKHFGRDHQPMFGGRSSVGGETPELVKNASLVIATNSTSISYAIAFAKPLILVTSNQIQNGRDQYKASLIANIATETGARIFNIDREYTEQDLREAMVIDHAKYESYKRKYLTSRTDGKPNYQVLLDEVIFAED